MSLHPIKTKCMIIGSRNKLKNTDLLHLYINETSLENVNVHKVLGVYIDNTLSWHSHIDYVCKNLNNKVALLKNIIYFLTDEAKLLFYNAYLLPIFDYCCSIWGKDNKRYVHKISIIQKRIAKIILNKPIRSQGLLKSYIGFHLMKDVNITLQFWCIKY